MPVSAIVKPGFTLSDRIKIQQETIRNHSYIWIGKLSTIVFEAKRSISGFSQSRARWDNARQAAHLEDQPGLHPFSESQAKLWASITLDWLNFKNAPSVAISRDQRDILFPLGMTPLPAIPDPRWKPAHAQHACPNSKKGCKGCIPPRIPQKLVGCPVVGDRVQDKITARDGRVYGVLHPIVELCVMLGGSQGGFARIRGMVDPTDGTHLSLLLDDSDPDHLEGFFVGGRFQLGG